MRKISILLVLLGVIVGNRLFAQAAALDNSFGTNGKVMTSVGTGGGEGWSALMLDDWTIVVGGYEFNGADSDFAVIKYLQNGNLDSTFGVNGKVTTAMGSGNAIIHALVTQPDGKIVAAGWAWNGSNYDIALARYNTNGYLDNSFGNNGKVITAIGPGDDKGTSLMMESDWTIVVGGSSFNGTDDDFAVIKYKTNGSLDSAFGNNGVVITAMGAGNDDINAIAIQSDSNIVVAGTVTNGTHNNFGLARYQKNGAPDNSFGTNGKVITTGGANDDKAYSMFLQPDGKIVVGGYSGNGVNDDFGVMRYQTNGNPDNSFGTNGKVITAIGDSDEAIYAMVLQNDGKIIAVGSSVSGGAEQYAMARYHTNGSLDNNFGNNGIATTAISAGNNEAYAVALTPDWKKFVVAGYADNGANKDFCIARFISGLALGVVDFAANNNELLIYPNPVPQNATLQYTLNKDDQVSIRLLDMQGKLVKTLISNQQQAAGEYTQPVLFPDALAPGSYLIVISSPDGQMSIKIVK